MKTLIVQAMRVFAGLLQLWFNIKYLVLRARLWVVDKRLSVCYRRGFRCNKKFNRLLTKAIDLEYRLDKYQ